MKHAIFIQKIGDRQVLSYISAGGMEALARLIPEGVTLVLVTTEEPAWHDVEKHIVLRRSL